jgi:hypothetical protein
MNKMKTTLATIAALAACASTQLFAQNVKVDTITMALTVMQQVSVSTSATVANAGNFSQGPKYYKTTTFKMTDKDILKAISFVMHTNASYYSSKATLQLVQGELGGFWNVNDAVAQSYADITDYIDYALVGTFNEEGSDTTFYDSGSTGYDDSTDGVVADYPIIFPDAYVGVLDSAENNFHDFATAVFTGQRIDIADGVSADSNQGGAYARLDTGRHFLPVPWADSTTQTPYATTGEYPVGHMQPWGQIFVKDPAAPGGYTAENPLCDNVTFFFCLAVEECYDCFYLSSYITDAQFSTKTTTPSQSGPPCCTVPSSTLLLGRGVDKYYLSLSFDNTQANPYLNPSTELVADDNNTIYYYNYVGHKGVAASVGVADGLTPDLLRYSDPIKSGLGFPSPYEVRFTLNGIVTYTWNLQLLNTTDLAADFVGTAKYDANGYGFIHLVCSLLTGTATFTEKVVKDVGCCDDTPWYASWYGIGADYGPTGTYHGTEEGFGYFDPQTSQFDAYPYYNVVGGVTYSTNFSRTLPDQYESPYNPGPALTNHKIIQCCGTEIGSFNLD